MKKIEHNTLKVSNAPGLLDRPKNQKRNRKLSKETMNWSDFDLAIGWQTPGNYPSWKSWIFSIVHVGNQGKLTRKTMLIYMITAFGLYLRLHILGPRGFVELRKGIKIE